MLANQFRIMYQSKEMSKEGKNNNEIASILEIHPYRVKLALEKSYKYNSDDLLKKLYRLSEMDIDIKTGKINKFLAIELFILSF